MNKESKVKINLNSKRESASPPVQFCKAKSRPDARKFSFMAKAFAHLDESVVAARWNSVEKTIEVTIRETPQFDVVRWLKYLNDQQHEMEKSPFVDMNTSAVLLSFRDESDNDVATVRFKNIKATKHECSLFKDSKSADCGIESASQSVTHFITLNYQFSEFSVVERAVEFNDVAEQQVEDKEWQTVETP